MENNTENIMRKFPNEAEVINESFEPTVVAIEGTRFVAVKTKPAIWQVALNGSLASLKEFKTQAGVVAFVMSKPWELIEVIGMQMAMGVNELEKERRPQ